MPRRTDVHADRREPRCAVHGQQLTRADQAHRYDRHTGRGGQPERAAPEPTKLTVARPGALGKHDHDTATVEKLRHRLEVGTTATTPAYRESAHSRPAHASAPAAGE